MIPLYNIMVVKGILVLVLHIIYNAELQTRWALESFACGPSTESTC